MNRLVQLVWIFFLHTVKSVHSFPWRKEAFCWKWKIFKGIWDVYGFIKRFQCTYFTAVGYAQSKPELLDFYMKNEGALRILNVLQHINCTETNNCMCIRYFCSWCNKNPVDWTHKWITSYTAFKKAAFTSRYLSKIIFHVLKAEFFQLTMVILYVKKQLPNYLVS